MIFKTEISQIQEVNK